MVFFVINILSIVCLLVFSSSMDKKNNSVQIKAFSSFFLSGGLQCASVLLLMICNSIGNIHVVNLVGKLFLFTTMVLSVAIFRYCILFPDYKITRLMKMLTIGLIVFIAYYCFFQIGNVSISENGRIQILSDEFSLLSISQFYIITIFCMIILPLFGIICLLFRVIFNKNRILKFQMVLSAMVFIGSILFSIIIAFGFNFNPSIIFLNPIVTIFIIAMLYIVSSTRQVLGIKRIAISIRDFFINYIGFGVLAALIFTFCFFNLSLLWVVVGLAGFFVLFFTHAYIQEKIQTKKNHNTADYSFALEDFFSKVNYHSDINDVMKSVCDTLTLYLESSGIEFFIGSKDSELSIVYSTRDFSNKTINLDKKMFEVLGDSNISILSRSQLKENRKISEIRQEAEDLFNECDSEAMIFIREERHLFAIISLAKKRRSTEYSDFDLNILQYLYPHFFVFAYFIKNMMKQSLVGTIDREIEFSDQIIKSIQENMDKITQPTLDVGYISLSSRNLGGDFVDFIRLTETRHMFILGDISGKGLNASMSMVILKSLMRTFLSETTDFKELIEKVNKFIKFNLPRGTFFAGVFMIIDFHDSVLYYANCGVPGIFLYTEAYNNVIEIQGEGKILGFANDVSKLIKVRKIKLNPGDVVLTCTDGLIDSLSLRGDFYGKHRVQDLLLENRSYSAEQINQFIHDDLVEFTTKGIDDDVSIVTLKILEKK